MEEEQSSLQDRLRDHAKAFDGLLSLIPAKMYYGEDTSDQWKRKKQTKAEAAAARRGKLDPDSDMNKNAKEIMDERARKKRKLQQVEHDDDASSSEEAEQDVAGGIEQPGEGLKKKADDEDSNKKPKLSPEDEGAEAREEKSKKAQAKEEKRLLKQQKKKERKAEKTKGSDDAPGEPQPTPKKKEDKKKPAPNPKEDENAGHVPEASANHVDNEPVGAQTKKAATKQKARPSEALGAGITKDTTSAISTPSSPPDSPIFDAAMPEKQTQADVASTTTSVSSTVPPSEKPKHIKIPHDYTALRVRLDAKLSALRAARRADEKPIRTRQELIESRRTKEAQRKAHKKELRRIAKEEEDRKREEALASSRNSPGSIMSPMLDFGSSPADAAANNSFAFGRVSFGDGAQLSHDLSYVLSKDKKKGPSDPKTALAKLEAQKKRVAEMNEGRREEVEDKERWLSARRRAEGEKVRDDESLLKKAVKRKDKAKRKSEREWKDRASAVESSMKDRQRRREDNLRKRREDKAAGKAGGKKKKGGAGGGGGGGGAKKGKNRPGFEGSFGGRRK